MCIYMYIYECVCVWIINIKNENNSYKKLINLITGNALRPILVLYVLWINYKWKFTLELKIDEINIKR